MTAKRIFVTGASGCIGHYVTEALVQETDHELFLLVRNPDKLKLDVSSRPGITVLQGGMQDIGRFSELLKTIDCAILIATAWGGPQEVFDTNVVQTKKLMNLLDPDTCQQVIYFSTASILDRNNQPLKQAAEIGTDYIRTKYLCYTSLSGLEIAPRITTLFPTLVLGGDSQKPRSHISSGIAEVTKWANLLRFFKADGSFHFIHARDIAQVVVYLVDHPPEAGDRRNLILGNPAVTVNQMVEEACEYLHRPIYFRIPLTMGLANFFIALFRIRMAAWDRFCMENPHLTYQDPVTPETFGLRTYCATLTDVLKLSGVEPASQL